MDHSIPGFDQACTLQNSVMLLNNNHWAVRISAYNEILDDKRRSLDETTIRAFDFLNEP